MYLSSNAPLNKISYGTIAGLLAALIFWALKKYAGVSLDAEGTALITSLVSVLVAGLAGYLTPLSKGEVSAIVQSPDAPVQS